MADNMNTIQERLRRWSNHVANEEFEMCAEAADTIDALAEALGKMIYLQEDNPYSWGERAGKWLDEAKDLLDNPYSWGERAGKWLDEAKDLLAKLEGK